MVAKIESGKSLTGALYYNEHKVDLGKAELLTTNGYTKSDDLLSFNDKLFRLTDLAGRNLRTRTNTIHLSLNFDINESIADEKLANIADEYMRRIGFEDQPYLVYKHLDAGHPHIHVVSTNIQADGKRISLNNIGKLKSEPARKAIELEFGLVKAGDKKQLGEQIDVLNVKPIEYGKSDTKRSITNVVNNVAKAYKFTSLPELNAVLNLYNVTAYRGTKESVMFKNGGLNYWVTNEKGLRVGVPIKASSIYQKPTLKLMESRFKLNEYLRKPFKEMLKRKIDQAKNQSVSLDHFKIKLRDDQVTVVVRQNSDGRIYGLSYIDQLNKVVFNGSDLGKAYSARAIIEALKFPVNDNGSAAAGSTEKQDAAVSKETASSLNTMGRTLLDDLLNPQETNQGMPNQFGPKKKKKKRRNLNL
jgi:hypothetical protein